MAGERRHWNHGTQRNGLHDCRRHRENGQRASGPPEGGSRGARLRAPRPLESSRQRRPQMARQGWRNPFKFLFTTTRREQYVEQYVLREHGKGRAFAEILEDPYVRAWSTPEERARLLEQPKVVAAVGQEAIADLRAAVAELSAPGAATAPSSRHVPAAGERAAGRSGGEVGWL